VSKVFISIIKMKQKRRAWTRNELIVTFNIYCKIEFSKINYRNPLIQSLANLIGRTPSAVAWKLVNFASLDSELTKRGIKGAKNSSKLDKEIFNEFINNWELLVEESESLLQQYHQINKEQQNIILKLKEGKETLRFVKTRVNQSFFRDAVLSSYSASCCLTGINIPELLVASHIIPWSKDKKNRLNPQNGLCLNSLHDKAFDRGLISFDENYRLILSTEIKRKRNKYFSDLEGNQMTLPKKFLPKLEFLEYHHKVIFKK